MTAYETYCNEATNIKHGREREGGKFLVLGWLVTDGEFEKRFALNADEQKMETEWRPRGESWFNKPGTKWFNVSVIPGNAEFIGNYVDDMFTATD